MKNCDCGYVVLDMAKLIIYKLLDKMFPNKMVVDIGTSKINNSLKVCFNKKASANQ